MDSNNQKPDLAAETIDRSQSGSSRRVMWRAGDNEEEVFDSIVNYRHLSTSRCLKRTSSSNSEHELPSTSKPLQSENANLPEPNAKSSTSLALRYKPSHESLQELAIMKRARAIGCWHSLFDQIRNKNRVDRSAPSLALRYKPSHESLKKVRSKEHVSRSTGALKRKTTITDVKLETCFFPPYQTAVVREAAPKFATRLCLPNDSDSCFSETLELRIPLLKSNKTKYSRAEQVMKDSTSSSYNQTPAQNTSKPKRRIRTPVNTGNTNDTGSVSKDNIANKPNNNGNDGKPMPTLRQRQLELHRIRVQIEKRRLELLDLKIVRERADALRHEILFHKDLQLKHNQIKSYEDNNSSQA